MSSKPKESLITANPVSKALRAYFSGVVLYGLGLFIYTYHPFYTGFINKNDIGLSQISEIFLALLKNIVDPVTAQGLAANIQVFVGTVFEIVGKHTYSVLIHLFVAYLVVGLFWFLFYRRADLDSNRPYLFWKSLKKVVLHLGDYLKKLGTHKEIPRLPVTREEKTNFLFFLVKFFYLPLMTNFFFGNFGALLGSLGDLARMNAQIPEDVSIRIIYFSIFNLLLLIDTAYFMFGYAFEFDRWKNKVKSVEPTFLGWFVTLACYPPFNDLTSKYLSWGSTDYTTFFGSLGWTKVFLTINILLFVIYVWATVSLGLKSSNLTNRGIVMKGAYGIIRHPAYASKNLAWFIMGLPGIVISITGMFQYLGNPAAQLSQLPAVVLAGLAPLLSILAWMFLYFLRAVTEERHLSEDPDYQVYCKKVKYRFIPGVW